MCHRKIILITGLSLTLTYTGTGSIPFKSQKINVSQVSC